MAVEKDQAIEAIENEDTAIELADGKPKKLDEEELQRFQGSVFDALMAAASYETDESEQYLIRIRRNIRGQEVVVLEFNIHPLSEEKILQIRKRNTKVKRDRRYGFDREDTDQVRYRSQLIYEATVAGDRDRLWNDKKAWKQLNVLNGIDLIDKVLMAGEKLKIIDAIETISGYGDDEELATLVKN